VVSAHSAHAADGDAPSVWARWGVASVYLSTQHQKWPRPAAPPARHSLRPSPIQMGGTLPCQYALPVDLLWGWFPA